MTEQQRQALSQIAPAAVVSERLTGVPAELAAAQVILESGWLQRCVGCNAFGIKARPGRDRQLLQTQEWFTDAEVAAFLARGDGRTAELVEPERRNGERRLYKVRDWFAAYPSLAEALADHARLITDGRPYAAAWQQYRKTGDLDRLVLGVAAKYATDPGYGNKLLAIIRMPAVRDALSAVRAGDTV